MDENRLLRATVVERSSFPFYFAIAHMRLWAVPFEVPDEFYTILGSVSTAPRLKNIDKCVAQGVCLATR